MAKNLNRGWNALLKSYPDSEKINALSFAAETLFTRLLAKVDDNANFSAGKKTLLGQLYSKKWEDGRISVRKVGILLQELIDVGLVKTYEHNGSPYLHILNCKKALRSDAGRDIRFPSAPACIHTCIQRRNETDTGMYTLDKTRQEHNRQDKTTPPLPPVKKSKIEFDFEARTWAEITDAKLAQWTEAFPAVDVAMELKRAALWVLDNPSKRKKQWGRFLTNWLGRTQEKGGNRGRSDQTGRSFAQESKIGTTVNNDA